MKNLIFLLHYSWKLAKILIYDKMLLLFFFSFSFIFITAFFNKHSFSSLSLFFLFCSSNSKSLMSFSFLTSNSSRWMMICFSKVPCNVFKASTTIFSLFNFLFFCLQAFLPYVHNCITFSSSAILESMSKTPTSSKLAFTFTRGWFSKLIIGFCLFNSLVLVSSLVRHFGFFNHNFPTMLKFEWLFISELKYLKCFPFRQKQIQLSNYNKNNNQIWQVYIMINKYYEINMILYHIFWDCDAFRISF